MGNPWVTSPPPVPIPVCLCVPQRCAGWGCTHRGIPHRGTHDERVCVGVCAGMRACRRGASVCNMRVCVVWLCVRVWCEHVRMRACACVHLGGYARKGPMACSDL